MNNSGDRQSPGLLPLAGRSPSVLILGSYPSAISLEKQEYYANKTNRFWRIMGALFSFDHELPYPERQEILKKHGVALWDVISSCSRKGSSDSSICDEEYNDLMTFLKEYPSVKCIALNGGKAGESFRKYLWGLPENERTDIENRLNILTLPSTSAANARYSLKRITMKWEGILDFCYI